MLYYKQIIKTELLLSGKSLTGRSKECGFFVKIQKRNRAIIRSVLRAQLNILYGVYRKNIQRLETVNYYCKKFHLWWVLRNRPVLAAQQKKKKISRAFLFFYGIEILKYFYILSKDNFFFTKRKKFFNIFQNRYSRPFHKKFFILSQNRISSKVHKNLFFLRKTFVWFLA